MVVGVKIMAFDKVTHLLGILKKTTITLKSGTKGESFCFWFGFNTNPNQTE